MTEPGHNVAQALSPISLRSADLESVELGSRWREAPAVLVFLRHFG